MVIGAIPTVGPYLVPQLIDRCRTLLPDVWIETLEDFAVRLLEEAVAGEIDFALVARPVPDGRLVMEPLFEEPLLLLARRGHPLAEKASIEPADLAGEPFILLGEKSSLTTQIGRVLGDGAVEPRVLHRCSQVDTVKAMVAAGHGLAILPQIVRDLRMDEKRRLVYRPLSAEPVKRTISLIRRKARFQSQASLAVTRVLRELL